MKFGTKYCLLSSLYPVTSRPPSQTHTQTLPSTLPYKNVHLPFAGCLPRSYCPLPPALTPSVQEFAGTLLYLPDPKLCLSLLRTIFTFPLLPLPLCPPKFLTLRPSNSLKCRILDEKYLHSPFQLPTRPPSTPQTPVSNKLS